MQASPSSFDPQRIVVVPSAPGPLRRLDALDADRDGVDDVLDDLFGEPDHRGPGAADAVLVVGGVGAIVAGQLAGWPTIVTGGGAIAAGVGLILPVRSLWRRGGARRRTRRMGSFVGDGMLLRTDHDLLQRIVATHDRIGALTTTGDRGTRARGVAHGAVLEVATLLEGRVPGNAAEREYVVARAESLDALVAALADPTLPAADHVERTAMVEARRDVEAIDGRSAVTEAADLVRDLREHRA